MNELWSKNDLAEYPKTGTPGSCLLVGGVSTLIGAIKCWIHLTMEGLLFGAYAHAEGLWPLGWTLIRQRMFHQVVVSLCLLAGMTFVYAVAIRHTDVHQEKTSESTTTRQTILKYVLSYSTIWRPAASLA